MSPFEVRSPYPSGSYFCATPPYIHGSTMKIKGEGKVEGRPDIAYITLGVVTENKDLKVTQEENSIRMNKIISLLKAMGITEKDIQTATFRIEPQYDYVEGKQVFRGYKVINQLQVTIRDLTKIGELIDTMVANGANIVGNIQFKLSNPESYYEEALKMALQNAVDKAKTLGKKLKVQVNQIPIYLEELSDGQGPSMEMFSLKATPATPIEAGNINIEASILAIFAYDDR